MDYKDENWPASYLLLWMIVNAVGLGFGVFLGELIGQWVGKTIERGTGVLLASIIFEAILWTARLSVLRNIEVFKVWGFIEKIIWFCSEMMGALLGIGLYEVTRDNWMTFGSIFGTLIGVGIIIPWWFVRLPKPKSRTRGLQSILLGIAAMVGGSFYIGGIFVLGQEMGRFFQKYIGHLGGLGVTGFIIGAFIGLTTGVAYLQMKVVKPFEPSVRS